MKEPGSEDRKSKFDIYILNVIILLFSGIANENLQYFTEQIRMFSANGDEVFVLEINARLRRHQMNAAYPSFIMSERFSPCKKLQNVNTYSLQFKEYLDILTNQRPYNSLNVRRYIFSLIMTSPYFYLFVLMLLIGKILVFFTPIVLAFDFS